MTFGQLLKQCKEAFDANEPSTHLVCKHSGMSFFVSVKAVALLSTSENIW